MGYVEYSFCLGHIMLYTWVRQSNTIHWPEQVTSAESASL